MNSLRILINPIILLVYYQLCLWYFWAKHALMYTLGIHCRGIFDKINNWPPREEFRLGQKVLWFLLKYKVGEDLVFETWLAHNFISIGHETSFYVLENRAFHLRFTPNEELVFERRFRFLYWSKFKAKGNVRSFTMCVDWGWLFCTWQKTWNVLLGLLGLLQFLDAVEREVLVVGQTIVNEGFRTVSSEVPLKSGI